MAEGARALPSRRVSTPETDPAAPVACPPCGGTGTVLSKLGGEEQTVRCPWCEGSGDFLPGHDAIVAGVQLREEAGTTPAPAPAPPTSDAAPTPPDQP